MFWNMQRDVELLVLPSLTPVTKKRMGKRADDEEEEEGERNQEKEGNSSHT